MVGALMERPAQAAADWTVPQEWERYTAAEHATWDLLFARQSRQLQAARHPPSCADVLHLSKPAIPDFRELSDRLGGLTGWRCGGGARVRAGRRLLRFSRTICRRMAGGLRGLGFGALDKLARLYWYTVEFGLLREGGAFRLFGSGIATARASSRSTIRARTASPSISSG